MSRVFEVYKNCLQLNNDFLANFWKKIKKFDKKKIFFFRFGDQKVPSMMDQQKICF